MNITTNTLSINNKPVKVHAISTGFVAVKNKFRETKQRGILAVLSFIFDRTFTEWMPIWVWVIEHPEGIFVIDTGENARVNDPDYFKTSGAFAKWLNTTQFKFKVGREEEIDQQLQKIGLSTDQVNKVLMTHMHIDHIDGLHHFPNSEILINKLEWEKPYGDLPKLYPDWLSPKLVEMDTSFENFPRAAYLTEGKDLLMIETPGHSHGHASFLLRTDQSNLLFAGDVVYYEDQIRKNKFSGGCVNFKQAAQTYKWIKTFAKNHSLVLLPSHDGQAAERLKNLQTL